MVFATTVNGHVVLVNDVLALLAVALDDEFLHLLYGEVYRDDFGDAEECALENGVGAVAKADFLCNLGCVDVIYGDIVLGEVAFDVVGQVLDKFVTFPNCVEKECASVAKAACHIIHAQVSLYVACHEVRRVYQVG